MKHYNKQHSEFAKQFEAVPLCRLHNCDESCKPHNKTKNRYQNIVAYDHTRVKLEPLKEKEKSDYINANYIEGHSGENVYIATQAPKSETINDFWRMILSHKSPAVIMLSNLKEQGKVKCVQYWPEKQSHSYGGIHVEVIETEHYADYVIRKLIIAYGKEEHQLLHMHFTSWPDHGCPEYPTMLLNFCHRFRNLILYENQPPVVVHCSAGVGRTGTFIVIDAMIQLIKEKQIVDIYNYFEIIRQNRIQMIQTVEQYKFVYSSIYECVCCGYTGIAATSLSATLKKLLSQKDERGKFLMEEEFERLNRVTPLLDEKYFVNSLKHINMAKNRFPEILASKSLINSLNFFNGDALCIP